MARRTIWTCDICGDTVSNACLIYQIIFEECRVDDEYMDEIGERDCYQICNNCINKVRKIFKKSEDSTC